MIKCQQSPELKTFKIRIIIGILLCYILIEVKDDQLLSLMSVLGGNNALIFWSVFVLRILILRYKPIFANIFLLI